MREPRALTFLFVALLACGDDEAPREPAPEPAASVAGEASETMDPCAADLADRTPQPVRATLRDLGYDAIFDDACRAHRAEEQHDPAACADLSVSALRDRCVLRVAVASARPLDCPPARTMEGRDPLCVAVAARDRRLCAAAGLVDEAVCARALGSEHACSHLPVSEREACAARATDLASRVDGTVRTSPALHPSFTVRSAEGDQRAIGSAARGARIAWQGCTRMLSLGETRSGATFGAASVALRLAIAGEAPYEATLGLALTDDASTLALSLDGLQVENATGQASITTLEDTLGGLVEGTFHASMGAGRSAVDGTFTTFVRDRDERPADCP